MKRCYISSKYTMGTLFLIRKFIFWQQYFTLQLSSKRERKVGWLVVLFYGISTLFGSFKTALSHFQAIQFSIDIIFCLHAVKCQNSCILNNSVQHKYTVSMSRTVPLQTIPFSIQKQYILNNSVSISIQFSSIWPIDRNLSSATTTGQSGPGSSGNEGLLRIPQSASISKTSPSDCSVSYPGHSLAGGGGG